MGYPIGICYINLWKGIKRDSESNLECDWFRVNSRHPGSLLCRTTCTNIWVCHIAMYIAMYFAICFTYISYSRLLQVISWCVLLFWKWKKKDNVSWCTFILLLISAKRALIMFGHIKLHCPIIVHFIPMKTPKVLCL